MKKLFERKYRYLVAYHYDTGLGTAVVNRNKKIRTVEDVNTLKSDIELLCNLRNVGIINYILLKK